MKLVTLHATLIAMLSVGLAAPRLVIAEDAVPTLPSSTTVTGAASPVGAVGATPSCTYPTHVRRLGGVAAASLTLNEIENNNTTSAAQALPLGPAFGQTLSIDVIASLSSNTDVDFYSFVADKGDVIGIATLGGPVPDMTLGLTSSGGSAILENFDHGSQANLYAPNSPLPGGADPTDATLAWIVPNSGTYYIRAKSDSLATSGNYTLQVRSSRPGIALQPSPNTQIVWLDFDGATINAVDLFGAGEPSANLSPLSAYLVGWGLFPSDEDAVIDAILAAVQENFDDLRLTSLNGNRPTDGVAGRMHLEVRNSRDHGDLWGQPNVARVIIGGSRFQLGIETIGIAEYIDVGNFTTEDTAVVLLDLFAADGFFYPDSINAITLDPSVTIIDAIGVVVGQTVCHEFGHMLGNWHTENDNTIWNVMDKGGAKTSAQRRSGVGPDGIFGTADDIDVDFVNEDFDAAEQIAFGLERTPLRTAFALSTGAGTLYLDSSNNSGIELGSFSFPYNTVSEGHNIVTPGGTVILMAGNYPEIITLTTPAIFNATGGTATIGTPP